MWRLATLHIIATLVLLALPIWGRTTPAERGLTAPQAVGLVYIILRLIWAVVFTIRIRHRSLSA